MGYGQVFRVSVAILGVTMAEAMSLSGIENSVGHLVFNLSVFPNLLS